MCRVGRRWERGCWWRWQDTRAWRHSTGNVAIAIAIASTAVSVSWDCGCVACGRRTVD